MLQVHGCLGRTTSSPTSPTGDLRVGLGVDQPDVEPLGGLQPGGARRARSSPYGDRIGAQVSVRPKTSTNASMPKRSLNSSTIELAVGAAKTQRSTLSASSGRGGCFQTKSIITPMKLVTVTPDSRSWSTQRLALNLRPQHERGAPAISAG